MESMSNKADSFVHHLCWGANPGGYNLTETKKQLAAKVIEAAVLVWESAPAWDKSSMWGRLDRIAKENGSSAQEAASRYKPHSGL